MSLTRIVCPECGAGLKSGSGFSAGETVSCPKCETTFAVEDPDDADAEEAPRKKRRRDDDEDDDGRGKKGSYRNSPLRYAVLGVLVTVMIVLGVMLYQKKKREKEAAKAPNPDDAPAPVLPVGGPGPRPINPFNGPRPGGPQMGGPGFPGGPGFQGSGGPGPNQARPGGPAGGFAIPPIGLPGGAVDVQKVRAELGQKLVGTWEGTAPDGSVHKVQYQADGQYSHKVEGPKGSMTGGKYQVTGLVGTKGLKLNLNRGGRPVTVVFEDDELIHDTGTPGQSVVLRKK